MKIFQYYPFLKSLTSEIKDLIDWEELYIPNSFEAMLLTELSDKLDRNIVLYKQGYNNKLGVSLSSVIVAATLTEKEQEAMKAMAKKLDSLFVTFCYNRPLELCSDSSSQNRNSQPLQSSENETVR